MSLALDSNNYNPKNIDKESPQIPDLESGQISRDKYSFLCGSKVIWDQYSVQEQSCLAYSYGERLKVCRNTDRKLFIAQDFVNFQQHFLGLECSLVEKDRRLPLSSIPAPRDRKFAYEWREVTDVFPQLPCQATLPSYSSGYPTESGCRDCVLEFSDDSCLLIKDSRAIGVRFQNIVVSLTHLSKEDIDNCITYLIYGGLINRTVVSNPDWIGHVCADIESRCFGLTERETVLFEQYVLDCSIYYSLTVDNLRQFTRLSNLTAEDLHKYQNSECGQYTIAVNYGRHSDLTKPTYVPSYTARAYVMAGKSVDLSKAYGVPGYKGAKEKDPDYRYQGEKVDTIAVYHTRSGGRKSATSTMSVSTEHASTSSSTLPDEQASGSYVENADSVSSDNTWNCMYEDCESSDDESPRRLHSSKAEYTFEIVKASVKKPVTHKLNRHCQFTHVERVRGCLKDFGLYTSVDCRKFVLPAEIRVNLSKHPIFVPDDLDVEKRYDMKDNPFLTKCREDAEKWKTHIKLGTEDAVYSMTALEVAMFAFRYGSIMPLELIPNLLYVRNVVEDKEEKDK